MTAGSHCTGGSQHISASTGGTQNSAPSPKVAALKPRTERSAPRWRMNSEYRPKLAAPPRDQRSPGAKRRAARRSMSPRLTRITMPAATTSMPSRRRGVMASP